MMTLDAYIRQENITLYKKLLADRNISDGQRDVIRASCWLMKRPDFSTRVRKSQTANALAARL